MKCAQNRRTTSSVCDQSLCNVCIKRPENFLRYRLHKLGTKESWGWTDDNFYVRKVANKAKTTQQVPFNLNEINLIVRLSAPMQMKFIP